MDAKIENFDKRDLVSEATKKPLTEAGAKRAENWRVPLDKLKVMPGFNVRENTKEYKEHIRNLADLMIAESQREGATPGRGWKDAYPAEVLMIGGDIFIAGAHSRLAAAQLANTEQPGTVVDVLCIPKPAGTTMEELTIGLHTSNNGKQLTTLELAMVVKRLTVQFEKSPTQIGKDLAMSATYATQLLALANAPKKIHQMITAGQLSASLAIQRIMAVGANAALEEFLNAGGKDEGDEKEEEEGEGGGGTSTETKPKKITARGMKTSEQKAEAKMKSLAVKMFTLVAELMEKPPAGIDKELGNKIDDLLFTVERVRGDE